MGLACQTSAMTSGQCLRGALLRYYRCFGSNFGRGGLWGARHSVSSPARRSWCGSPPGSPRWWCCSAPSSRLRHHHRSLDHPSHASRPNPGPVGELGAGIIMAVVYTTSWRGPSSHWPVRVTCAGCSNGRRTGGTRRPSGAKSSATPGVRQNPPTVTFSNPQDPDTLLKQQILSPPNLAAVFHSFFLNEVSWRKFSLWLNVLASRPCKAERVGRLLR